MRHVLGLSGKDSLCAALIIKAHKPDLWSKLEIFSTLTGADYPETLAWLNSLPKLLEKPIIFIDGDLQTAIARYTTGDRGFLPSQKARYCTKEAKLQPFERWLAGESATLYTGIRADEQRIGYKANSQIQSRFPLVEFNFDLGRVWSLVLGLPVEFQPPTFYWQEIHDLAREAWRVQSPLVGGELDEHLTFIQRIVLMSGRSRPNCFFCFNQRRYEVVWLYETHPDLFEIMKSYEKPGYAWLKGFPLSMLTEKERDRLKWDRAKAIALSVGAQAYLGMAEEDGFQEMRSCGLFCGK